MRVASVRQAFRCRNVRIEDSFANSPGLRARQDPVQKASWPSQFAIGLNITVSEADFANLKRQVRDAITFLKAHESALRRLAHHAGVEDLTLDFGIAKRNVAAQFDYFPPELLLLAGRLNIGLEITTYHAFGGG